MIGWKAKPSTTETEKPKGFDDFELRLGDVMRGERATLGKSLLDVQRELKIKATYIAAIENADVSAFETPGFVAGYVRSYARYLGLDPDWAFKRFCAEADFAVAHGMSAAAAPARAAQVRSRAGTDFSDPLANPNATFVPRAESAFARIEPGALGSVAVLAALIVALGYGGWSVLQEVQRVQLAPMDQAPSVVAEIDPLGSAGKAPELVVNQTASGPALDPVLDPVQQVATNSADRIDRPDALDVPVLVSRDGPISAIDPRQTAAVAGQADGSGLVAAASPEETVQVLAEVKPGVEVLAVRPSWVRVNSADGTVLFEKILDAGERYAVPVLEEEAVFRTGNSGSVYFVVNGKTYGPAAPGANVAKNIPLKAEAIVASLTEADLEGDADLQRFTTNVADAGALVDPAAGGLSE